MTKKEDLEKLILDSYQIVHKNNQKILVAEPREKSRLRQENDENWEYIKTFLAEYTSLCEARRLVALEDIIDIAATRFPDISARLEVASTAKPVSTPPVVPSTPNILSKENDSLFQVNYKFVHPFTQLDKEQLVQFIVRFNSTSSAQSSYLNVIKHICLVLDVSGSMNTSDKYPYLLQSIPYVIDSLQDNDKLSIILFSTQSALVWSSDIATCRQHKRDILKAIDQSHVKFNTTCLAPGLRMAIDEIKHVRVDQPEVITRLYILTDGQLHDSQQCYLLNSELRQYEIEVNSFGFGQDFAQETMRQIMEGCLGGRVKWIGDTDTLWQNFYHIGEVAQNIVATDGDLELTFSQNVTPGDAFRFEPGRYRFDPIDDKSKRFYNRIGPLEKDRDYIFAFEARVFPSQNQQEQIATAIVRYLSQSRQQIVKHNIVVNRTGNKEQLNQTDKETETLFLILEEFRTNDPQILMQSLQAQLKILLDEGKYPAQIKLLENVIAKLAQEGSVNVISELEKRQMRGDYPTVSNFDD